MSCKSNMASHVYSMFCCNKLERCILTVLTSPVSLTSEVSLCSCLINCFAVAMPPEYQLIQYKASSDVRASSEMNASI